MFACLFILPKVTVSLPWTMNIMGENVVFVALPFFPLLPILLFYSSHFVQATSSSKVAPQKIFLPDPKQAI